MGIKFQTAVIMKFFYSLFSLIFFSTAIAFAIDVPVFAVAGAITGLNLLTRVPSGVLLSKGEDVSALTAYAGKNLPYLLRTMINALTAAEDMIVMPNIKNKLRIGKLVVSTGIRPFSSAQEFGINDLTYTDRFLQVEPWKRELQIDTESYRTTYLSEFLTPGDAATKDARSKIPFVQFTMESILKQIAADLNNNTVYNGFDGSATAAYSAASTYAIGDRMTYTQNNRKEWFECVTATTAGQNPDTHAEKWKNVTAAAIVKGINTIIGDEITASNITPEAIGAITTATEALDGNIQLFRSHDQVYQDAGIVINQSYEDFNLLLDSIDDKAKYVTYDITNRAPKHIVIPRTNGKGIAKPATWITGRRLIAGPSQIRNGNVRNNALLFGTDLLSDMNQIEFKSPELWLLNMGLKALAGFQIANVDEIRVSDQS